MRNTILLFISALLMLALAGCATHQEKQAEFLKNKNAFTGRSFNVSNNARMGVKFFGSADFDDSGFDFVPAVANAVKAAVERAGYETFEFEPNLGGPDEVNEWKRTKRRTFLTINFAYFSKEQGGYLYYSALTYNTENAPKIIRGQEMPLEFDPTGLSTEEKYHALEAYLAPYLDTVFAYLVSEVEARQGTIRK